MRLSRSLVAVVSLGTLIVVAVVTACSTEALKAPKSDSNFDDPDEPPATGVIGAVDASTADAGSDVVVQCNTTAECPTSFTCYFPVAEGCAATIGTCIVYLQSSGCAVHSRCGCNGSVVRECSPEGYASARVSGSGPCGDAAAEDDAGDAAPE
jgi:hypothetical protein